jgi:LPXTG-motif cell wall-anchored protein
MRALLLPLLFLVGCGITQPTLDPVTGEEAPSVIAAIVDPLVETVVENPDLISNPSSWSAGDYTVAVGGVLAALYAGWLALKRKKKPLA